MVYCCVPFCKSRPDRVKNKLEHIKVSFHDFPLDQNLQRQWLMRIARKDFVPKLRTDKSRSVVCGKHFTPDDFMPNLKVRRLKKGAVPTVFPMYPSYALFPPPKSSPSLDHDHVKKPRTKKYERKILKKQNDPANLEMKSNSNNKSADQHTEDRVFIKEAEINQDNSSCLLQTLNRLERMSTENSRKINTITSVTSNPEMTSVDNNSPKPPGVNSTEKYCTDIEFYSNIFSTNNNPSVQSPTFNEENTDISFIRINEDETTTINDGSGILFNSDIISTNNNLPEQSSEVYMSSINEIKQDYPCANNYHSLVSLNHQERRPVSETECFTLANLASMDFNSSMTFTNSSSKQSSVVGVCPTNISQKGLPSKSKNFSLISLNCIGMLPTGETKLATKKDNTVDAVNSDTTSQSENLADQTKANCGLSLKELISRRVAVKNKRIKGLKTMLLEKNQELEKMKEKIDKLEQKVDKLEEKVSVYESNNHHLTNIGVENSPKSNFILDQIANFFKKQPTWRECTLRECAAWAASSPKGYDFVREQKLMALPSRRTVQKYAYSGEQKVDFGNPGPCQEASSEELDTED